MARDKKASLYFDIKVSRNCGKRLILLECEGLEFIVDGTTYMCQNGSALTKGSELGSEEGCFGKVVLFGSVPIQVQAASIFTLQ